MFSYVLLYGEKWRRTEHAPRSWIQMDTWKRSGQELESGHLSKTMGKKTPLLYHIRDKTTGHNILAKMVTLRKDNPDAVFVLQSEDGRLHTASTIWFKGGHC